MWEPAGESRPAGPRLPDGHVVHGQPRPGFTRLEGSRGGRHRDLGVSVTGCSAPQRRRSTHARCRRRAAALGTLFRCGRRVDRRGPGRRADGRRDGSGRGSGDGGRRHDRDELISDRGRGARRRILRRPRLSGPQPPAHRQDHSEDGGCGEERASRDRAGGSPLPEGAGPRPGTPPGQGRRRRERQGRTVEPDCSSRASQTAASRHDESCAPPLAPWRTARRGFSSAPEDGHDRQGDSHARPGFAGAAPGAASQRATVVSPRKGTLPRTARRDDAQGVYVAPRQLVPVTFPGSCFGSAHDVPSPSPGRGLLSELLGDAESIRRTTPRPSLMRLGVFRSLWTMPTAWMASSPRATWIPMSKASWAGSAPRSRRICLKSTPSTSSMEMNRCWPSSPYS